MKNLFKYWKQIKDNKLSKYWNNVFCFFKYKKQKSNIKVINFSKGNPPY